MFENSNKIKGFYFKKWCEAKSQNNIVATYPIAGLQNKLKRMKI